MYSLLHLMYRTLHHHLLVPIEKLVNMSHNVFLFLLLLVVIFHLAHADFEFTTSYPQECTPLNITWKPDWSAFPYSVYFMVIGAQVQSWQIKSDYQPNAQEITFQYVLPKLGQPFQSFMVAVVDSKGNGNSSQVLVPKSLDKHPSNCSDFAGTNGWTFASDLKSANGGPNNQDRLQCEVLSYYAVEQFTGSGPFSYSLVPTQGTPITVNVPKSAQTGSSHFYYESILPLKQGTTFFSSCLMHLVVEMEEVVHCTLLDQVKMIHACKIILN